jgi:glutaryl-CoA dehydrogenase
MYPIYAFGNEEQKEQWLPRMAKGEVIACFGLTEPNHGSDPSSMETRAVKDGDFWVLNGEKAWITNGTIARLAIVWARTDDGIRGFLVETDNPGFSAVNVKNKLSLRASVTSNLSFTDCRIPAGNLLPGTEGLKSALSCLNEARFGIAWGAVGAAMSCFETVLDYTKQRVQFDRPIAAFQLTQEKLADMITEITKAQLLCVRLARLKEEGRATPAQISMAKRNNVRMALDVARTCRGMLGAVRRRHHGGPARLPAHGEPGERLHLRGHTRDPHAHPGPGPHRHRGLQLAAGFRRPAIQRLHSVESLPKSDGLIFPLRPGN